MIGVLLLSLLVSAPPATARWRTHVEVLASDAMRGRQTGSPEHLAAARYVVRELKSFGIRAELQPVPFAWRRIDEPHSAVDLVVGDRVEPLVLGADATVAMAIDPPSALEAPVVFAGYGLSVPEQGYDDLAKIDLHGKVVAYLNGAPARITEPRRSQAQFAAERWARFREKGAIGVIGIRNPKRAEGPWEKVAAQRFSPGMSLAEPDVDERQGQKLALNVNSATAQKWFEGSGHGFDEILALADSGAALPAFDLAAKVRARVACEKKLVTSQNVVAVLEGRDPALAKEYVVLTAHLDHLGIGAPVAGDSIYNGAMDNASGVAALLEVARALSAHRPKRSVLFLFVTGEEKGLLGSYYWTRRPTVPMSRVVADVNIDMVLPIVPLEHVVVRGLDESTLGDLVRQPGIDVLPDPEPQQNRFIRSDQFSFIRAGIPAIALAAGAVKGSPADSLLHAWLRTRYHEPSDDLAQPYDPAAPAALIRYLAGLTARIADAPGRPSWRSESFFRRFAAAP